MNILNVVLGQEGQASIYSWDKKEIIQNYILLEEDYDRTLLLLSELNSLNLNLSNQISLHKNVTFWNTQKVETEKRISKLKHRKRMMISVISSIAITAISVIGIDLWLTKKFN